MSFHFLEQLYGRHHVLVDGYEMSVSRMTVDLLPFTYNIFFRQSPTKTFWARINEKRDRCLINNRTAYTSRVPGFIPCSVLYIFLSVVFGLCLAPVVV